jgi:hypothetical protein
MGKKKTPVFRNGADKDVDFTEGAKIDAIKTWDDVEHDSEDDCKSNNQIRSSLSTFTKLLIIYISPRR